MKHPSPIPSLRRLLWPVDGHRVSHGERWFSALAGFAGMYGLLWVSGRLLDLQGAALVVGSMGATLVLVFAVPHGALSQPWAVFGGHLVSALIGVSCARWIADPWLAAAAAVGLAIGAMYYLRCIHPPGGATALVAVLGGEGIRELGYGFVLHPVLENLLIVLVLGVAVNFPFRHRRYPAVLARSPAPARAAATRRAEAAPLTPAQLRYALARLDSFIDVSEQDLMRIYELARQYDPQDSEGAEAVPASGAAATRLGGGLAGAGGGQGDHAG